MENQTNIIIYITEDGKSKVNLLAKDNSVWMSQNQIAELFDTSIPNISMHISNILKSRELEEISVVKDYLTTAPDGKNYKHPNSTIQNLWAGSRRKREYIVSIYKYLH